MLSQSNVQQRGIVRFPAFLGQRIYMREFTKAGGLPRDLLRWQDTVDAMLDGVETDGPIFLMVDQAPLRALTTHRRPGLHIDGCWMPGAQSNGAHVIKSNGQHSHVHDDAMHSEREIIILASDVLGCAAYVGPYVGYAQVGGDCSHVDIRGMERVDMEPGRVWVGDTMAMLHESLPVARDCLRTVVRLNVRSSA